MADMLYWIAPRGEMLNGILAPGELEAIREALKGGQPYAIPSNSASIQGEEMATSAKPMRPGLKRAAEEFANDHEKRMRRDPE
jgi:hypothetical protein